MNTDGPAISHMRRPQPRERTTRPACYGDPRFTTADPELAAEAAVICKTVCKAKTCRPILAAILATAVGRTTLEGVWDGVVYTEAGNQKAARKGPAPIKHGSRNGARAHRDRKEKPCDRCRLAENAEKRKTRERGAAA